MKNKLFLTTKNNHVKFLFNGPEYSEVFLDSIKKASKSIHLQTYIFEMDDFGKLVFEALSDAVRRGVHVYVLVDAIGSRLLNAESEKQIISAGIHFYRFNGIRIKWLYRFGRRLHHKVLLVDQACCIVGGINITNPCAPGSDVPVLDFAVYLEGPVTFKLSQYCQMVLKKSCAQNINLPELHKETLSYPKGHDVRLSVNDWVYGHQKITKLYSQLTIDAQKEITIINSYFFPRKKFMKQLAAAAKRGVRVRLILPTFSDWPSYILASEYLYSYFLKNGVEIYQWKKSILHGKLASIDGSWSTIGSYNLNYTSYQQNLEINVNIYSETFTEKLNSKIEHLILPGCEKIDPLIFSEKSSFKTRASRFFFYLILSLVTNFSIGITFQEEDNNELRIYNIVRFIASLFFLILGIAGIILPILPGIPFLFISFLLVYRQILLNKKKI